MRPFQEILLFTFYFSENSELSNSLISLMQRFNNQRTKLLHNIEKVNLVESNNYSYLKISRNINKLMALYSYSQNWL